jgi:hypothetical protein
MEAIKTVVKVIAELAKAIGCLLMLAAAAILGGFLVTAIFTMPWLVIVIIIIAIFY